MTTVEKNSYHAVVEKQRGYPSFPEDKTSVHSDVPAGSIGRINGGVGAKNKAEEGNSGDRETHDLYYNV